MDNVICLFQMEVVCCVCGVHIEWKAASKPDQVSHGYCKICYAEALAEIESLASYRLEYDEAKAISGDLRDELDNG